MAPPQRLLQSKQGPVAYVTLHRPDVHNAFDAELIAEIHQAFTDLGEDPEVRVIVLSGEGKNFCAGADVNWMKSTIDFTTAQNEKDALQLHRMLEAIYLCPKPTIARIQGVAFGGGVGLASAVDVGVASFDSQFCLSEVRLGILPAVISTFVIRKMGLGGLRAYGLSAKKFSAEEALRVGLVNEVVPFTELDSAIHRWIDVFLEGGPQAQAVFKNLSLGVYGASLEEASKRTVKTIAKVRVGKEGQEGLRAFLEKRTPTWRSTR